MYGEYAAMMAGYGAFYQPDPEEQFLTKLKNEVFESVKEGMTFETWLGLSEKSIAGRCINTAWARFKEELQKIEPPTKRWVAHVPSARWMEMPLDERSRLGARPFHDAVLVEGVGEPPALVAEWAYVR